MRLWTVMRSVVNTYWEGKVETVNNDQDHFFLVTCWEWKSGGSEQWSIAFYLVTCWEGSMNWKHAYKLGVAWTKGLHRDSTLVNMKLADFWNVTLCSLQACEAARSFNSAAAVGKRESPRLLPHASPGNEGSIWCHWGQPQRTLPFAALALGMTSSLT